MKENLTKEGFWNELHAQYPNSVNKFCEWVDQYKLENGWADLFKDGIKFHDIPLAFQLGILMEYFSNVDGSSLEIEQYKQDIVWFFGHENERQKMVTDEN